MAKKTNDWLSKEDTRASEFSKKEEDFVNPSASNEPKKKVKTAQYFRAYLSYETIVKLYDLVYTKEQSQKFTQDDAISQALDELTKEMKLKKAPKHYMGQLDKKFKEKLKGR